MHDRAVIRTWFKLAILLWFVLAVVFQQNFGLADNGDFFRAMEPFVSGPLSTGPELAKPYYFYWIPYWQLDWQLVPPRSSAVLLWLPGVVLNTIVYSASVLYLPAISLLPKLILLIWLLLLFRWAARLGRAEGVLLASLGVPLGLIFADSSYLAYFNSFYMETASFVFLFVFLATLLYLQQRRTRRALALAVGALFLLSAARPSNLYWPLLGLLFVLGVWYRGRVVTWPRRGLVYGALALLLTLPAALLTRVGEFDANPYNSLFYGALTFSKDPQEHLEQLGMPNAARCVGVDAYTPQGIRCRESFCEQISFGSTARVIAAEPAVFVRMVYHAARNMQDISLEYLGHVAFNHPLWRPPGDLVYDPAEERFWNGAQQPGRFNLWSQLKYYLFPTGSLLLLSLILFAGWFIVQLRTAGIQHDLALLGLLAVLASGIDMQIAVLGDGRYELIKHLFLANLLFDVALMAFAAGLLLAGSQRLLNRKGRANCTKA